jgi:hypothetical protein
MFNLHSILGFRYRVPLQLASFLRATNGKQGWIRRPGFGLPGPDASVATTTRARIVEWLAEIVPIQKPVKATARRPVPARIPRQRIRLHAGGNHGGEARLFDQLAILE